ncbi:MAG TPA: hypothetical protein VMT58_03390, partial [Candidatus Binataceae bacterium]|nr:hypothetical protein [Candidatus Binataceae bacterium]
EYRLLLREDNADRRLSSIGARLGLLGAETDARVRAKAERVRGEIERISAALVPASGAANACLAQCGSTPIQEPVRAIELLKRPEISYATILQLAALAPALTTDEAAELEIDVKYDGYVRRQAEAIDRFKRLEETTLPEWLDYRGVAGLSTEARERLSAMRPRSLGQAARMPGITPAAVSLIAVHLRSGRRRA